METIVQPAGLPRHDTKPLPVAAALTALGIVYGDIGTSPLYAFKQAALASGALTPQTILGLISLILWTLILIVALKYAILIMRADNHGEGGVMAILALLDVRRAPPGSLRAGLLTVGLIGAALLYNRQLAAKPSVLNWLPVSGAEEQFEPDRRNDKQIDAGDVGGVIAQESLPTRRARAMTP